AEAQVYPLETETSEQLHETAKQAPASEKAEAAAHDQRATEHAPVTAAATPIQPTVSQTKRAPSRFVWQVDAEGRFTNISGDLAEGVGAAQAGRVGEDWAALAARAGIANTDALLAAVKRRDTWSGVSVLWPVEGTETARPVDLAALPVFDRDRNFLGYRGFGVFREAIPFIAKAKPVALANETTVHEPAALAEIPEVISPPAEDAGLPSHAVAEDSDSETAHEETSAQETSAQETSTHEEVSLVRKIEAEHVTPAALLEEKLSEAAATDETEETAANDEFPLPHEIAEEHGATALIEEKLSETTSEDETEETAANDEFPLPHEHEPAEFEALRAAAQAAMNGTMAPSESSEDAPLTEPEPETETETETETASLAAIDESDAAPREAQDQETQDRKALTPKEQVAFREIGRVLLQDTLEHERAGVLRDLDRAMNPQSLRAESQTEAETQSPEHETPSEPAPMLAATPDLTGVSERALMDRIPLGIAVHRDEKLLYANRALLDWAGYENLEALERAGGLHRVFSTALPEDADPTVSRALAMRGPNDEPIPVETRLFSTPWYGKAALVYVLRRANAGFDEKRENMERSLRAAEAATRDQQAILDTATDGVLIIDRDGKILGMNKSAEALFSFDFAEVRDASFTMLFAPESHRAAVDYLDKLASNGVASILNDGREVVGRERNGGLIPLFMNLGKVGDDGQKFCAVLRDITQWKRAEEELTSARRQAETASSHKSDFLAKISHEMRTPLNAIIGFAEVMIEERFGPIGSERYRDYLKDIHQSGAHLISLINDLLDLSKIEAGKLELDFTSVDLNDVAKQCISIMQPQANRERIIIRTALAEHLPPVVADLRSIRQIVLNLLSNSVKFTRPGGQVILSTSTTDKGEVVMRVRDTGIGMTEEEVTAALEPFRQLATSGRDTKEGTGLGLPLTKALVEANRASFQIKSTVNSGTLIEIAFPSTRVLAG
ncbi:MAG: histidine kinase dimerization/phospho-acceptor domain-containing protein, partial [Xanthobacteraceae bacterium]